MDNLSINILKIRNNTGKDYLSVFYVEFKDFNYLMADPIIAHHADFRVVLMIIY